MLALPKISKPHTPSHRHREQSSKQQRDPRRSHPDRDTRKPADKQAANLDTPGHGHPTRLSRPTAAHLGAHGGGGGPIDLEAHEIHQLCHLWHVLGPLLSQVPGISKPHTPPHRHWDQTPVGPKALTSRPRHTQAQASKQPTSRRSDAESADTVTPTGDSDTRKHRHPAATVVTDTTRVRADQPPPT